jgi:hypothetical protein
MEGLQNAQEKTSCETPSSYGEETGSRRGVSERHRKEIFEEWQHGWHNDFESFFDFLTQNFRQADRFQAEIETIEAGCYSSICNQTSNGERDTCIVIGPEVFHGRCSIHNTRYGRSETVSYSAIPNSHERS